MMYILLIAIICVCVYILITRSEPDPFDENYPNWDPTEQDPTDYYL